MAELIQVVNLSKSYGKTKVVDRLNLSIKAGEIVGFLGLNGAGKTTTMRMLLGLVKPTSGQCYLMGKKVGLGQEAIWKQVGFIIETPHSYPELTVRENLQIVMDLRGVRDKQRLDWALERLKLKKYRDKKVKQLSLGNAQRLGIAKAILHKPKILILDEPTNGLDPLGIVEVRELLNELVKKEGTSIFISSHKLEEISKIASRIVMIDEGHLIGELDSNELDRQLEKRLLIKASKPSLMREVLLSHGYKLDSQDKLGTDDADIVLRDPKALQRPEKIAELLVAASCPPKELRLEKEDLEHYFFRQLKAYKEEQHHGLSD